MDRFMELASTQESGSTVNDDVYTSVMGPERHGRVRGFGLGPTPTSIFGPSSSQSQGSYVAVYSQLEDMRSEVESLRERERFCEHEMQEMKKTMEQMQKYMHQIMPNPHNEDP